MPKPVRCCATCSMQRLPPRVPRPALRPTSRSCSRRRGRTIVIGAGKASAAMAKAVEDQWPHPLEGLVVTRYGYGEACAKIEIVEAAHPVPDEKGRAAAGRILERVKGHTPDDLVLCLISGGASALLALPAPGLTLGDKQDGQPRAAEVGRQHRRDEHGAKAPLGHQGRPARGRRPAGARAELADLRRAQRRSRRDRLGPDRARPHDLRRCAGGARQVPHRSAGGRARPSREGRGGRHRGDAQARRSAPGAASRPSSWQRPSARSRRRPLSPASAASRS